MIITTTPSIEGKKVSKYIGVVSGETILGANIFKDIFAAFRDVFGGRSATYERELKRAKDMALKEMTEQAKGLGANAILAIDFDYETVGGKGSMLLVSVTGTAVVLE